MAKRSKPETVAPPKVQPQSRVRVLRTEDPDPEPTPVDDSGLSLDDLGQAYAALLGRGAVPYEDAPEQAPAAAAEEDEADALELEEPEPNPQVEDRACELSPKSILEAMLFVGHPQNEPLSARQVASLMRGVLPEEIDELVVELNAHYAAEGTPYFIESVGAGYRMSLREAFGPLRDHLYGRVKEARLSQSAIDTLALVAYHQPVTLKGVDDRRGKPSGGILGQLVRRQLVMVERDSAKPKELRYRTTPRFLDLFGLESLDDLPRSQDLE